MNDDQIFDFDNHTLYGNLTLNEFRRITLSAGTVYSRSKKDVNIESINFDFGLSYALSNLYGLEVKYYVYNFDDFLVRDQYYTSNIAELNLIRNISF